MKRVPRTGSVRVKLSGLMFDRFVSRNDGQAYYEVGILRAIGHELKICYEIRTLAKVLIGAAQVAAPQEGNWVLRVRDNLAPADKFINEGLKFDRQVLSTDPDLPQEIKMDFRWVPDLEGKEFDKHESPLALDSKKLHPVIRFPQGLIFTEELSPILVRSFDGSTPEYFGRISNVTGVDIDARPGKEIVLQNLETKEAAFVIPLVDKTKVTIFIGNNQPLMEPQDHPSCHFRLFYSAITNARKKYDLQVAQMPKHEAHTSLDETFTEFIDNEPYPTSLSDETLEVLAGSDEPPEVDAGEKGEIPVCIGGSGGGGAPICGRAFLGKHDAPF